MSCRSLFISALTAMVLSLMAAIPAQAQYSVGDREISGALCVGSDCINGESFGLDTIRMKKANLRLYFDDTSSTSSFPTNDWRIVANDSDRRDINQMGPGNGQ